VSTMSETKTSATILTSKRARTVRLAEAEAMVTMAPARRRTSAMMTASMGSVPSAIGTKTLREVAIRAVEESVGVKKEKRF